MAQLCEANPHLPLCQEVLKFKDDIHIQSLLMMIVYDYAQWEGSDGEGLQFETISDLYPEEFECDFIREHLRDGDHPLMICGYIEQKCTDGMANTEQYMLTTRAKTELLSAYKPSHRKCRRMQRRMENRYLKNHESIKEKSLFFNTTDQQQIDRQTGRDIMQVDIAGMRDKFVGESEKNIKAVFARYRDLCHNSEVAPILFFNEADALINKRTEHIEHSVDKMDNAMQNIILQELEDLEGILIATTNLTNNLDSAFERRFLYKVEFHKPDTDVKTKIWCSMLKDICPDDARQLASHFDFSGGQIENIARKRTIDYILSGIVPSLKDLEAYCRAEQLNTKKEHKPVGFKL